MNAEERKAIGQAQRVVQQIVEREDWTGQLVRSHLHSVQAHLSAAMNAPVQEVTGDKEVIWSENGRRVVVVEGKQAFVEVGGEIVKVLTIAKSPSTEKQKKAAFLRKMDKKANRPKLSKQAEAEMWREYWAEHDRQEVIDRAEHSSRAAAGTGELAGVAAAGG